MKIYKDDLVQIIFYVFMALLYLNYVCFSTTKLFLSLSSVEVYTVGYFEDINKTETIMKPFNF